jgi:nickel-dependent lactate racemase
MRAAEVLPFVGEALAGENLNGARVLLIVPDLTRTAPVGIFFRAIHQALAGCVSRLDVMFALGTHPPMDLASMCRRLEITPEDRQGMYQSVDLLNHQWNSDAALDTLGVLSREEVSTLTRGLFECEVPVRINRCVHNYDLLLIVGPVFPHEVVGFSGGNKYLFPGISGPEILNFFHWLGAVITNPRIIGHADTPVRSVIDQAAQMVPVPKRAFALVVDESGLQDAFYGTPETAWRDAVSASRKRHIVRHDQPYTTVVSHCPPMYSELWVAGKCMYKLEPVVADGGELVIVAPHLAEISQAHGMSIRSIGYHVRDYFLEQWEQFAGYPWGVLAHSTHVRGIGTYQGGIEHGRIRVTLASQISREVCDEIGLGYRSLSEIPSLADGSETLVVPKAGEILHRLRDEPEWAQPFGDAP